MKLNSGQSRDTLGRSVGLPCSGVSGAAGARPLWMQILKKPGWLASSLRLLRISS